MERAGSAVELRPARRRAARCTRRSVSIAPPKVGRGTECARPELSVRGACTAVASAGVIRSRPPATFVLGLIRPKRRRAMTKFVGLDVSLKTTSICVVEADGSPVWEGKA